MTAAKSAIHPVAVRFRGLVAGEEGLGDGDGVLVALSGGADSVTLLHLLRFTPGLPALALAAAHVDHGMRPDSAEDARWVEGLCRAWGVPLSLHRLDPAPGGEAEARRARYEALETARRGLGFGRLVTAHHLDDQAETVLFRAVRGTGLAGLQGIRARRSPGLWRPLLPFTREELLEYAGAHLLTWREDSTNVLPMARNVLRHRVLPQLEAEVAPGARRALAGLARRVGRDEAALRSLEWEALIGAGLREESGGGWSVDAAALQRRPPAVRARLVRALARRLGGVPGEGGTRRAVEFTSPRGGPGEVPLGAGVTLRRELDRFLVLRKGTAQEAGELRIPGVSPGGGSVTVGREEYGVAWGGGGGGEATGDWETTLALRAVCFPLTVRGWSPGDRVRLSYGSKKLKKLFLESRVPPSRRSRVPVVVSAMGEVLWVPGIATAAAALPAGNDETFMIRISHADPH